MTLLELTSFIKELGEPAFRARQVMDWLQKGQDFSEMRNLPQSLIKRLSEHAVALPAAILERHVSSIDGTVKYLFRLLDGHTVEGVLMRYRHGLTFCLSTQVGCRMGCAFCASTLGGRLRDLTAGEMLGMVILANRECGEERLNNLVLMGSGEPFDNYDNVLRFLRLVTSPEGLNIGSRHISLSTCGLTDRLLTFAEEGIPLTLSVSLHASNDALRRSIMPVAQAHPLAELMQACRQYVEKTGRRVVFEYALIQGVNDSLDNARELAGLLRGFQCHVNLIPLNDVPERGLKAASPQAVKAFLSELERLHISATVRRQMGDDIFGACGQLRAQHLKTPLLDPEQGEKA